MSSFFIQALEAESEAVFLNDGEFAEEVELDGRKVLAVISERASLNPSDYSPEIPGRTIVLHVATASVDAEVDMGGTVRLGGDLCSVVSRRDGMGGMTRLELARNGY